MRGTASLKNRLQLGFSLIEIAIGMIVVGLVLIPSISFYQDFNAKHDFQETEEDLRNVVIQLNSFNTTYNRYPCPAPRDAVRGTNAYGFEVAGCSALAIAPGTCQNGLCRYATPDPLKFILVGMLPFKTLNMGEEEVYDSYQGRYKYAVTAALTDGVLYTQDGGGIGIVSKDNFGVSMVEPPNSAHFIVISHGQNQSGAFTGAGGTGLCPTGSLAEQENCDGDSIFAVGEVSPDFDDRTAYYSGILPTEWKKEDAGSQDIFLKDSDSIALGVTMDDDLTTSDEFTIKRIGSDSGVAIADGSFFLEELCDETEGDCFEPHLFAGELLGDDIDSDGTVDRLYVSSPGTGISCYEPGVRDEFLVGIEAGIPECTSEIFLTCPNSSFIASVNANGEITCSQVGQSCGAQQITTTCGDSWTLPETGDRHYSSAYSGECHMFSDAANAYDQDHFEDFTDDALQQIKDMGITDEDTVASLYEAMLNTEINRINNMPRDIGNCGTQAHEALIRDTYQCENGAWTGAPISVHETIWPGKNFTRHVDLVGTSWDAETDGNPPFDGDGNYNDMNNSEGNHDCWCREDIRLMILSCTNSSEEKRYLVQKHVCPQTQHSWNTVIYESGERLCTCNAGPAEPDTESCLDYYNRINGTSHTGGLDGTVTINNWLFCPEAKEPYIEVESIDTSDCHCASGLNNISRDLCGPATTNDWTSIFGHEVGVESLSYEEWSCPGTSTNDVPDPATLNLIEVSPIPECVCNEYFVDYEIRDCEDGKDGYLRYEKEWDCNINDFEPESEWTLVEDTCVSCHVVGEGPSTGSPGDGNLGYVDVGTECNCDDPAPLFCTDGSNYWSGGSCQCNPQGQ